MFFLEAEVALIRADAAQYPGGGPIPEWGLNKYLLTNGTLLKQKKKNETG